jgi:DHA2 family multidrug resistance protein
VLGLAVGVPLFGVTLHVQYMQELLGFPLAAAGIVIGLRALALLISAPLGTLLTFRGVDSRLLISSGFAICAIAFAWENAGITTTADLRVFFWPELLIGVGFGLTFGPLLTTVTTNLPAIRGPFAIAMMNLSFVAAGSFANSWLVTIFDHRRAQHVSDLAGGITLVRASIFATMHGADSRVAHELSRLVAQQAAVLAFADAALCAAAVAAMAIPFALLLRPANPRALHAAEGDDGPQQASVPA